MPQIRKADVSFLYATHCLVLLYISTKYDQNISKEIRVTKRTRKQFQEQNKVR